MSDESEDGMNVQQIRRFVEAFRQALIQFRRKHYELGGLLLRVRDDRVFVSWPRANGAHGERGYTSWDAFCEPETGYTTRTCDQLCHNFQSLQEFELEEDGLLFSQCMRIGWSKLGVVMRYVNGPSNRFRDGHDQLELALSAAEIMPEVRLRAHLASARRDQALNQARAQTGNPELQAEDIGDPDEPLAPANPAGYVPYSLRFDNNASLETFTRAVELIRERYAQNLGHGRCVSMMSLFYLANHTRDTEGGAALDVESMLRMFEDSYGMRFKVDTSRATRTTKKKTSKKKASKKKMSKKVARRRNLRSEAR